MKIQDKIHDIVELKKKHNLVEDDATYNKQVSWYDFAIRNGLVILEYQKDRLVGFLEFVRLKSIPNQIDDFQRYITDATGSVLLVGNCIAEDRNTFLKLKNEAIQRNKDVLFYCWHRKKTDIIRLFKNQRRWHENAFALS